ncbi:MAG: AtpZ/AtpI family protein [Planctomycetes bacterium]|nr:AtpZ/AtpI family protein [Planctomycetota bacterium]
MPSDPSIWRPVMALAAVGWVLVVSIVLGYFGGSYLDRKLGTEPWFLVVGVALGTIAGFVQLWRVVKRSLK